MPFLCPLVDCRRCAFHARAMSRGRGAQKPASGGAEAQKLEGLPNHCNPKEIFRGLVKVHRRIYGTFMEGPGNPHGIFTGSNPTFPPVRRLRNLAALRKSPEQDQFYLVWSP
jgi:hypothetical protein